jgi:hypothetical protein
VPGDKTRLLYSWRIYDKYGDLGLEVRGVSYEWDSKI